VPHAKDAKDAKGVEGFFAFCLLPFPRSVVCGPWSVVASGISFAPAMGRPFRARLDVGDGYLGFRSALHPRL
jgi:hypothetical protein